MTLLEMTLSGGLMILLITVIRALAIERLPKRLFLALWGAALLRLLIPFSVPFHYSLYSLAERGTYAVSEPAAVTHNQEITRTVRLSELSIQRAPDNSVDPWTVLWLIGLALAVLYFAAAYVRHFRRFRSAGTVDNAFVSGWLASHPLRRTVSIRESGSVTAPLTYGVLRPVILVPTGLDWEDSVTLDYAFTHEYTHICRFDALLRLLLMAALCVHWFNPLVWVMYILALRDIELSCDEAVVRRFGLDSRRAYALALLKMEETRQRFNAFASGFSKSAAEERIRAILKLGRTSARRVAASVLVTLCVLGVFCVTSAGAAGYDALVESPNLVHMSIEYITVGQFQGPRGGSNGIFAYLRAGSFIKLKITGRGEGVFGFFLYHKDTDEVKGQWITLDGSTHELWLEVPADGEYRIWTPRNYQRPDGADDYFTYKVTYNCYSPDGEHLGARYRRQNMFSGYFSETYTHTAD